MKFLILLLLPISAIAKGLVPGSFSANFEESLISAASGKEKKTFGKIDYKFPGQIRFEVTSEPRKIFVTDGKTSWLYDPPFIASEDGQVTVQKGGKNQLTRFLDSLKNGLENSRQFTTKYQGKVLVVSFTKDAQKDLGLKEAHLESEKEAKAVSSLGEFEKLVLVKSDGSKSSLRLIDFKQDPGLPADHFTFKVPAKTKVINQ